MCWGYWWLPANHWQAQVVSSAADLAGASLGVALPATILTEGAIVLVRLLTQDRRERILEEGKEDRDKELLKEADTSGSITINGRRFVPEQPDKDTTPTTERTTS